MAVNKNKKNIVVFAKAPIAGEVKTRLTPFLTAASAALLHRNLVLHSLQTMTALADCSVELWVGSQHSWWDELSEQYDIPVFEQRGKDLGERMLYALGNALQRSEKVLIVGTDCPAITPNYLQLAFDGLEQKGVVIGPADDGGYVLLGLKQLLPSLFDDIQWGGDNVLAATLARLQSAGERYFELASLMDIDRPEDFSKLEQLSPELTRGLRG